MIFFFFKWKKIKKWKWTLKPTAMRSFSSLQSLLDKDIHIKCAIKSPTQSWMLTSKKIPKPKLLVRRLQRLEWSWFAEKLHQKPTLVPSFLRYAQLMGKVFELAGKFLLKNEDQYLPSVLRYAGLLTTRQLREKNFNSRKDFF